MKEVIIARTTSPAFIEELKYMRVPESLMLVRAEVDFV
jgi:hypothetical protein